MSISLLFWVIYILCIIFTLWADWPAAGANYKPLGGRVLSFVLIGLLGWATFGAAIHR